MNAKEALEFILEYEVPYNKFIKNLNDEVQKDIDESAELVKKQTAQIFDEQVRNGLEADLAGKNLSYEEHKAEMVAASKNFIEEEVEAFRADAEEVFDFFPPKMLEITNLLMDNLGFENAISNEKLCELLSAATDEQWRYKIEHRLSSNLRQNGDGVLDYHLIFENDVVYFDATPGGVNFFGADIDADNYEYSLLENIDWLKYFLISKEVFDYKDLYTLDIGLQIPNEVEKIILAQMENIEIKGKDDDDNTNS